PATAAWPRLMPPSLGGTRPWRSTRKPPCSRAPTQRWSRSRFWNTPPDRATVSRPRSARSRWHTADTPAASPVWKRAAMSGVGVEEPAGAGGERRRHAGPGQADHARPPVLVAGHDRKAGGRGAVEGGVEVGGGHPPRLLDGGRPTGHGHRRQVGHPFEAGEVG